MVHRAVAAVADRGGHVEVDGTPARHLVAADGLHSTVRRLVGLEATVRSRRRFGLRCHLATAPWTTYVEVHWSPAGEAYVTPVAADLVGLAVLTDRRQPLAELLAGFPTLASRLRDGAPTRGPRRRAAAAAVHRAGCRDGCCSSATRPGTSTR